MSDLLGWVKKKREAAEREKSDATSGDRYARIAELEYDLTHWRTLESMVEDKRASDT